MAQDGEGTAVSQVTDGSIAGGSATAPGKLETGERSGGDEGATRVAG